jgi:D-glycero-alpha-D-manno-heptose-7-phosphate kinase
VAKRFRLRIPARINVVGNPTDACEVDYQVMTASVDVYAHARVEPAADVILSFQDGPSAVVPRSATGDASLASEGLKILAEPINELHDYSEQFRAALERGGISITVWTEVPRQSGLGGSSLLVLLVLGALREFYTLDKRIHNDYVLAELAQRIEEHRLGVFCGYADRYVPLFGGLAYVDYHGKFEHKPIQHEPYATYERLDSFVGSIKFALCFTGVSHDSGSVHDELRRSYLEEIAETEEDGPLFGLYREIGDAAWRAKIKLLDGDLAGFGEEMTENHRLIDEIMRRCGFEQGVGEANNLLVEVALKQGALGAKTTGAGGGGSVFALCLEGEEARIARAMAKAAHENGFTEAQSQVCRVVRHGLTVEPVA